MKENILNFLTPHAYVFDCFRYQAAYISPCCESVGREIMFKTGLKKLKDIYLLTEKNVENKALILLAIERLLKMMDLSREQRDWLELLSYIAFLNKKNKQLFKMIQYNK